MAPREIIHDATTGTRLVEVRHEMPRGLSVSRYLLVRPGHGEPDRFTTLRKARAAFRAQTEEPGLGVATGTRDA